MFAAGLVAFLGCVVDTSGAPASGDQARPNIVFMIADDLGYGDLGSYGQRKIRTPQLDRMAAEGMRFTQHYAGNAVCAPSRCVLMTGKHPGHAYVRNNREVKPEGQTPLAAAEITLPEALHAQGYVTGGFGKWGLGPPASEGDPLHQGFDRFYGYNCQRVAHNYYPTYLWDNDRRVTLQNMDFAAHQKFPLDADPQDSSSYARYSGRDYSADLISEQARQFIRANRNQPFFLYYPTTVPHLALQVPEDSLAEYRGVFPETPYDGSRAYLPHFEPRAAYAAMITRLDREIGSFLELVKDLGLEERTIFVFTSDNGPLYDRLGGTDTDFFESAGPLRGRKGSLYEGGIRVPLIVRWKGRIKAGSVSERVCGFEDWFPTILELAGAPLAVPPGLDGITFVPTLLGQDQDPRPFLYREFPGYGGQQAVRVGDWKAIRQNLGKAVAADAPLGTELYNLREDLAETRDVAGENPEMLRRLERLMREQHQPSALFPLRPFDRDAALQPGDG